MTNQCNDYNPLNNATQYREAPVRAEVQELQQMMQMVQQEMHQIREMMEHMHMGPIRYHKDNLAHEDDGIRVRPIPHQRPTPINQPPSYDDFS